MLYRNGSIGFPLVDALKIYVHKDFIHRTFNDWLLQLARLARHKNVVCKICALQARTQNLRLKGAFFINFVGRLGTLYLICV